MSSLYNYDDYELIWMKMCCYYNIGDNLNVFWSRVYIISLYRPNLTQSPKNHLQSSLSRVKTPERWSSTMMSDHDDIALLLFLFSASLIPLLRNLSDNHITCEIFNMFNSLQIFVTRKKITQTKQRNKDYDVTNDSNFIFKTVTIYQVLKKRLDFHDFRHPFLSLILYTSYIDNEQKTFTFPPAHRREFSHLAFLTGDTFQQGSVAVGRISMMLVSIRKM